MNLLPIHRCHRLSAIALATLLPLLALAPTAQANLERPPSSGICRGTEVLAPDHPQVKALRDLGLRYRLGLSQVNTRRSHDRSEIAQELHQALQTLYVQVRSQNVRVLDSDVALIEALQTEFQADLYANSLTIFDRRSFTAPIATEVTQLQTWQQKYGIATSIANNPSRFQYIQAVNQLVDRISAQSQKDPKLVERLLKEDWSNVNNLNSQYGTKQITIAMLGDKVDLKADHAQLVTIAQKVGIRLRDNQITQIGRYEFAAMLNVVLDRSTELLAAGNKTTLSASDRAVIQRLQQQYAPELAILRGRVESLEARAAILESQQFSTTTNLQGAVLFPGNLSLTGQDRLTTRVAGGSPPVQPSIRSLPKAPAPTIAPPSPPNVNKPITSAEPRPFDDRDRLHKPGTGNTEGYNVIEENPFQRPNHAPLSTFSIDVDTASYSNTRRFLTNGQMPPKDAVRIEELINYFPYRYPQPQSDQPFSVNTEVTQAPWNPQHKLVRIGLQGKQLQEVPPSNLVFLVDVSGSMNAPNKLPLVQRSLCLLTRQLTARDRVTLVVYAGNAGMVLPPTPGDQTEKIMAAIEQLQAGGSTAGGEGIALAYKKAQEALIKGGNNRVILATDGDFNVGISSDAELVRLIEQKRDRGIFLTVLGFGTGNYKDGKMEQLANKGNGNYAYIDTYNEAKKVLAHDLRGTLFTIAKDVKIQVEFNPAEVQAYRLIGYENRMLRDQDFNDDRKDAGEIGAGHSVTALYEIIPTGIQPQVKLPSIDDLKYQKPLGEAIASNTSDMMQVKLRYKSPTGSTSQLITHTIAAAAKPLESASSEMQFATSVAMFGLLLRDSEFKGQASVTDVLKLANRSRGEDAAGYRSEFIRLVERYQSIASSNRPDQKAQR